MANPPLVIPLAANTSFWCNGSVYLVEPQDLVADQNNPGNWVPSAGAKKLNQVQVNQFPAQNLLPAYVPVVEVASAQPGVAVPNVVAQVLVLIPNLIAGGYVGGAALFDPALNFFSSDDTPVTVPGTGVQPIACWPQGVGPAANSATIPAGSTWQPAAADLAAANLLTTGGDGHVCLGATAYLSTDEQPLGPNLFFPVGSTSGNPWQAQRNIHIVPSVGGQIRYGFAAGNPRTNGTRLNLSLGLVRTPPAPALHPADVKTLQESSLRHMTFQPSPLGPKAATLAHVPKKNEPRALVVPHAPVPAPGSGPGDTLHSIGVALRPGALASMQFSLDLDPDEAPGNVHVLDVVQYDPSGKVMGGIHILAVVV